MYSSPRGHLGEEKEEVENQRETTGLPTALLLLNVSLKASAKTVFSFADSWRQQQFTLAQRACLVGHEVA